MLPARKVLLCVLLLAVCAAAQITYQKPPQAILDVLDVPPTPVGTVNPSYTHMLLAQGVRYPTIAEAAEPFLGLAGLRVNPANNSSRLPTRYVGYTLKKIADGAETVVKVPANAHLSMPAWSPDGKRFASRNRTKDSVELWVGDTATGAIRQMKGVALNDAQGDSIAWAADSRTIYAMLVPANRGAAPAAPAAPSGPVVQEAAASSGPVRTFQDLLTNQHEENLFDYYVTAQLAKVNTDSGKVTPIGKPAVFLDVQSSPDGNFVLITRAHKPYSYLHVLEMFPRTTEVWDSAGKLVYSVVDQPLADRVPIQGVPTGRRSLTWVPTAPATLQWAEALDEGDPKKKVAKRDRISLLPITAGMTAEAKPQQMTETEHRFAGAQWLDDGKRVLISDYDRDRRWSRTYLFHGDNFAAEPKLVWSRSIQDRYSNPGAPVTRMLANGKRAVQTHGDAIFLAGVGDTPEGSRPFLHRWDLAAGKPAELYRSTADSYEAFSAMLSADGSRFVTVRESPADPPNYYIRGGGAPVAFTKFVDKAPQLRKIKKGLVKYKRADGVDLSFTLYLPPDYKQGTKLPTLVWAYPLEFNDPSTAGQVVGSTQRFTSIAGISHLFMLLEGYAILDNATMPVVGDPETVNDTFVQQIVSSAQAAIDKAVEMGVTDRDRVAVGGHSYGAFMTANLLAHSDLFRAGIARSGAYNRTLTPFGFQGERRTYWEAQETYLKMSPFNFAHKVNEPILMIHGAADNNSGTFPIQSDRMYQAVRGTGGTVRFVLLPHESHGYSARESVEHTLYEMLNWLDKWVKNPPSKPGQAVAAANQ